MCLIIAESCSRFGFGKVSSSSNLEVVPEAIHADLEITFRTKKEVEMSITSLKKEHKHLIEVLKSGSLKDRMKEAKSQGKEMKKY